MRLLVNELEASGPRPRSPHMNNEEPINLSHYPDGKKPDDESALRPIERDDFPGKSAGTTFTSSITTTGGPGFGSISSLQSCAKIRTHASSNRNSLIDS